VSARKTAGWVQVSARVPADLVTGLEAAARDADRTLSAELRRAITMYLCAQDHGKAA
jgi:Ribbon-helix-helix protein, copG family